jgi:hypothetical protein
MVSVLLLRIEPPGSRDESKPLIVALPPGSATLHIRAIDQSSAPASAQLVLRYNGEFVPQAFLRFVTGGEWFSVPASGEAVIPRLPPGSYELWVASTGEDEAAIVASNGMLRPPLAAVGLSVGEQNVVLRVARP